MTDNLSKLSLALPFALIVSAFYLYGYWYTFSVDFYSYISVSEMAITSIIPLMFVGVTTILGIAFGQWKIKKDGEKPESELIINIKQQKWFTRIFNKRRIPDIAFVVCAIITLFFGGNYKWLLIPIIIAIPFGFGVITGDFVKREVIKENISLIFLIIYPPSLSFGYGKMKALNVIDGVDFKYVISKDVISNCDEKLNQRYIGKIGDYLFIYDAKNEIVKIDEFNKNIPLTLKMRDSLHHKLCQ